MRRNIGFIFPIMVIVILITAFLFRYVISAPFIVAIIVFLVIRSKRIREEKEREEQKEYQKEQKDYQKDANTEFTGTYHTEHRTMETIITCDYCGSRFDAGKHATCPHCGGPYWDDEEWRNLRGRNTR